MVGSDSDHFLFGINSETTGVAHEAGRSRFSQG